MPVNTAPYTQRRTHNHFLALIATAGAVLAMSTTPAFAGPQVGVYVSTPVQWIAPPPPRVVAVPAPRAGYVWVTGHWEQRGRKHHWVDGYWIRQRPGYIYHQPAWSQAGGHWEYRKGGWDRDGDGVPDRYDRRPDNRHHS